MWITFKSRKIKSTRPTNSVKSTTLLEKTNKNPGNEIPR